MPRDPRSHSGARPGGVGRRPARGSRRRRCAGARASVKEFSHIDEAGGVQMVDVGAKPLSRRRARARARIEMKPDTAARLAELPKGDALTTAKVAGIMAAKRTSDLVPLCHPLQLTAIDIHVAIVENGADVTAAVETTAQT